MSSDSPGWLHRQIKESQERMKQWPNWMKRAAKMDSDNYMREHGIPIEPTAQKLCNHEKIYHTECILTTSPPKYRTFCVKCGMWGSTFCDKITNEKLVTGRAFYKMADEVMAKLQEG